MKVKIYTQKVITMEVTEEVFETLHKEHQKNACGNAPKKVYDEAIALIEQKTGFKVQPVCDDDIQDGETYIFAVESDDKVAILEF